MAGKNPFKVDVMEALRTEIVELREEIRRLQNITARFVLPQESLDELIAELRSLRYTISTEASRKNRHHEADAARELAKIKAHRKRKAGAGR